MYGEWAIRKNGHENLVGLEDTSFSKSRVHPCRARPFTLFNRTTEQGSGNRGRYAHPGMVGLESFKVFLHILELEPELLHGNAFLEEADRMGLAAGFQGSLALPGTFLNFYGFPWDADPDGFRFLDFRAFQGEPGPLNGGLGPFQNDFLGLLGQVVGLVHFS